MAYMEVNSACIIRGTGVKSRRARKKRVKITNSKEDSFVFMSREHRMQEEVRSYWWVHWYGVCCFLKQYLGGLPWWYAVCFLHFAYIEEWWYGYKIWSTFIAYLGVSQCYYNKGSRAKKQNTLEEKRKKHQRKRKWNSRKGRRKSSENSLEEAEAVLLNPECRSPFKWCVSLVLGGLIIFPSHLTLHHFRKVVILAAKGGLMYLLKKGRTIKTCKSCC